MIEAAWVIRGSRIFVFKKGQNSRMGKGCGSFHSTRRQVVGGSLLARVSTSLSFVIKNINNYIRARWGCAATSAEQHGPHNTQCSLTEAFGYSLGSFEVMQRQKFRRRRAV